MADALGNCTNRTIRTVRAISYNAAHFRTVSHNFVQFRTVSYNFVQQKGGLRKSAFFFDFSVFFCGFGTLNPGFSETEIFTLLPALPTAIMGC